jgi:putative ABC transport system permease protein
MPFIRDLKIAIRSLSRVPTLWITVALTLALGIGANAAIFSVVRAVLLRPLANQDEDRLLYIRQSAQGLGQVNANFSVPEIKDLGTGLKTISEIGTFSEIDFTIVGLGTPREIPAGVVDGNYFQVMGLRPVLGRLLGPGDDGPNAPAPSYSPTNTGVSPCIPIPASSAKSSASKAPWARAAQPSSASSSLPFPTPSQRKIIANVVTSPHHLSATMVTGRSHRMTEIFARLAPGATLEAARAELATSYASMTRLAS